MPFDRSAPLTVYVEPVGKAPKSWAWAIYRGANGFLITRSRPEYRERTDALEAGLKAAADVGRRLRVGVVAAEASHAQRVSA